jgi:hypothetical protein
MPIVLSVFAQITTVGNSLACVQTKRQAHRGILDLSTRRIIMHTKAVSKLSVTGCATLQVRYVTCYGWDTPIEMALSHQRNDESALRTILPSLCLGII